MRNARVRHQLGLGVLTLCLLALTAMPVTAKPTSSVPDPAANAAFASLIKAGAKFFYLGSYNGLDGWIAIKNGQLQIFYKPANNSYAIAGSLFAANGDNITGRQVKAAMAKNPELAALMPPDTASPAPPASSVPPVNDAAVKAEAALSPGERLLREMQHTSGISLGTNAEAPELFALVLPGTPTGRDLWQEIRNAVQRGDIRVRLFPVGRPDSEEERVGQALYQQADPLSAWDRYTRGDKAALTEAPVPAFVGKVRANTALGERWNLPTVPYLLYRAKDGHVKVVQGVPEHIDAVLDDMAAPNTGAP